MKANVQAFMQSLCAATCLYTSLCNLDEGSELLVNDLTDTLSTLMKVL